jgi:hypothetical protein
MLENQEFFFFYSQQCLIIYSPSDVDTEPHVRSSAKISFVPCMGLHHNKGKQQMKSRELLQVQGA